MLNRRVFLQRFGIGLASALALTALPKSAVAALTTERAAKRLACEHLRKVYSEWCAAHPGQWPAQMRVSEGLYAAYEGELSACERFTVGDVRYCDRVLVFKGSRVQPTAGMAGWDVEVDGWDGWVSYS